MKRIVSVTGGDARNDAAREIDAGGMTVMPGMIDTHGHLSGSPDINETVLTFLELGFTMKLRAAGCEANEVHRLKTDMDNLAPRRAQV